MATEEVIELSRRYVLLLNSQGLSVEKAYLFGSYAKGSETTLSDIDLLIVAKNYNEDDDLMAGRMWMLTRKVSTKIEPVFVSSDRFRDDDSSQLIQTVKSTGIEII